MSEVPDAPQGDTTDESAKRSPHVLYAREHVHMHSRLVSTPGGHGQVAVEQVLEFPVVAGFPWLSKTTAVDDLGG